MSEGRGEVWEGRSIREGVGSLRAPQLVQEHLQLQSSRAGKKLDHITTLKTSYGLGGLAQLVGLGEEGGGILTEPIRL